ncbi:hypothetical protein ACSYAD_02815 [Acaryochloris marina NIES-2412]|uniref:hypothetical protein n=1 Tax=Acaryochloris marina TaxID=155978 RepID=UPI0040598269
MSAPSRQFSQVTDIVEVSPPETIQKLRSKMDRYQPQVKILSPAADQLLKDDSVSVRFDVKDLPLFKDAKLDLGPHLNVLLDNQPAQEVYDLNQPLVFKDLAPGTHTIRAVATRPWSESFKNSSAFAQTTFHVFTKTEENNPSTDEPLLTYGQPQGVFGTDTVLIDFFLSNVLEKDSNSRNWQAQISVNGSKFHIDEWQPFYVQGLKPGKNWVQMQLMDRQGHKIENAFNNTIRIVELTENGNDTLSQIIRGDLSALDAGGIVDPNYKRPQPPVKPAPSPAPVLIPAPEAAKPSKTETPKSEPVPAPVLKQPAATPKPKVTTAPAPKPAPAKSVAPTKSAETKSPETQKQPDKPAKPTAPAQKVQKSADQTKGKASSSAPSSVRIPIKEDTPVTAKETEPGKSAPAPTKPRDSAVKAEKKPLTPEPKQKAEPPSVPKQPQPKPAEKSPVIKKTAPKSSEKSVSSQVDASSKSTAKTAAPRQETSKVSPTPAAKAPAPEPVKEKSKVRPNRSEQLKSAQKDEESTLTTTFTKFWQQVRPAQESAKPSTSTIGEKAPAKGAEPKPAPSSITPKKEESKPAPKSTAPKPIAPKPVESKPTPNLSAPSSKQPTTSPKNVQPSPRSTNQRGTPAKAKNSTTPPSQKAPAKPQVAPPSKSSSSRPPITQQPKSSAVKPKTAESSPKPVVISPEKPQPKAPVPKSGESNTSVFSGFRDRLQQLQKSAAPAVQKSSPSSPSPNSATPPSSVNSSATSEKATAPAKTTTKAKSTTSPSIDPTQKKMAKPAVESKEKSKPSALSTLRDRWQKQKQLMSPEEKVQLPVQPAPKKAPTAKAVTTPSKVSPARPSSPVKTEPKKSTSQSSTPKPSVAKPTAKESVKANSVEPKPASAQSPKPKQADSVFSSLRGKWQQQKQLTTSGQEAKPAPVKPASPKAPSTTTAAPQSPSQNKVVPARPSSTPAIQKKPTSQSAAQKSLKSTAKETVKAKPVEPKPATDQPAKSKQTDSVFSSLRDKWQQQKQLMSPTEQASPIPVKTAPKKATGATAATPKPLSQNKVSPATPSATLKAEQKKPVSQRIPAKSPQKPSQPTAKEPIKPIEPKSAAQSGQQKQADSVFSSLRSRWQQQQQQLKKTELKTTPATPKPTQPKASQSSTIKPNIATQKVSEQAKPAEPSRTQGKRRQWFQPPANQKKAVPAPTNSQKPSRPAQTSSKVSPSQPKTQRPNVTTPSASSSSQSKVSSSSQSVKKPVEALPKAQVQKSEPQVFDPGDYYRRFFPGKTTSIPPAPTPVNPSPSP